MMNSKKVFDHITHFTVLLIAALLPVFVVPVTWITTAQAKLMLIAVLVCVALVSWVIARLLEGTARIPRNILLYAGAFLPIAYGISALVTGGTWTSLIGTTVAQDTVVIVAIWFALLVLTSFSLSKNPRSLVGVLRAFLIGSFVLVVFQTIRLFFPDLTSLGGYLSGNSSSIFGTWHDLGIISGLVFFLSIALWNTPIAQSTPWKAFLGILGLCSLILLVVINTVDVWYALAALFFVFALYRAFDQKRTGALGSHFFTTILIWILLAGACGAAGFWSTQLYSFVPAKFQIVQLEVRPSWQGTYMIGQQVFTSPKTYLFGSGPNTFTREWGLFKPTGVNLTDFWNVDFNSGVGFIPTTFVTTGAIGVLAWAILLLALLWSIIRFLIGKGEKSVRSTLAPVLAVVAYIVAFQVMYVPGVALSALLFLFVGIVIELESAEPSGEPVEITLAGNSIPGMARVVGLVVVVGVVVLAPLMALRATTSDLLVQKAATLYAKTSDFAEPASLIQEAISIFPQSDVAHRAAVEIGLVQLSKLAGSAATDPVAQKELQSKLQSTIEHGLSAVSIDSGDYQNWLQLAFLYQNLAGVGTKGAYESAKSAYEKSILESPTNPLPHLRIAQMALAQGDTEVALTHLNKAISLKPNLAAAYYLRSQIEGAQGTYPQGIEDAGIAAQLAPQDPTAWYNLGAILYTAQSFDLARQALEKAVSIQNNYANAIFLLGVSYDNLGRHGEALAAMQAVAQLNPNDATVSQVIANIEAGKPALTPVAPTVPVTPTTPKGKTR